MRRNKPPRLFFVPCVSTVTVVGVLLTVPIGCGKPAHSAPAVATAAEQTDRPRSRNYETASLRGQVVWTADALAEHYGIRSTSDARERSLALVADDGRIYPLVEDAPGRAFRKDEQLRDCDVELFARYYPAAGMIQVVRTHLIKPEGKFLVDYWCDVCSISMTEQGDCSCCQQPNRLRERLVEEASGVEGE